MDFELDEVLVDLKELCKDFAEKVIAPNVAEWDSSEDARASKELFKKMGDVGFLGLCIPEEFGGSDLGYKAIAVAIEIGRAHV